MIHHVILPLPASTILTPCSSAALSPSVASPSLPHAPSRARAVPRLKSEPPLIRGTITKVYPAAEASQGQQRKAIAIFVAGVKEQDTQYDQARVGITEATHIFLKEQQNYQIVQSDHLTVDQRVEVLVTGAILESSPVQVTADEVVILK